MSFKKRLTELRGEAISVITNYIIKNGNCEIELISFLPNAVIQFHGPQVLINGIDIAYTETELLLAVADRMLIIFPQ